MAGINVGRVIGGGLLAGVVMNVVDAVTNGPRPPLERPGHDLEIGSRIEAYGRGRRMDEHVPTHEDADDQRRERAGDAQSGAPARSDALSSTDEGRLPMQQQAHRQRDTSGGVSPCALGQWLRWCRARS